MNLNDLLPYFELYKELKDSGKETVLNDELQEKEQEFVNKEITVSGIVNEIDTQKNELIITHRDKSDESDKIRNLISNHFFIFSSAGNIDDILKQFNIQKNDLVKVTGNIISLHRQSVLRIKLSSVSVTEKNHGLIKASDKKGCFIATAVYGSRETKEVLRFYELRDNVLSKSFGGRLFIKFYYAVSPFLAKWIDDKPGIKSFVRKNILDKILEKL
ncbi:MAG TPA: CFI-box-CTERM domain-containing protein [Puia sp.]|nr:CFI-box-CTERM domain-containing protein [Puia sp.]